MEVYLVGGAVRDELLGLPVKERDWVVVGASVSEMLRLGYKQVGKEFPVFLHPKTYEEYALARKERKIEPGYTGFTFEAHPLVTLEQDLLRRDLTINAMAKTRSGELIDPYGGKRDLEAKKLRHVSLAFVEDPVRVLRLARFLARYHALGFDVAPETIKLMREMARSGEMNALVAERVWKELERALGEKHPEQFFILLRKCEALPVLFPEFIPHMRFAMRALNAAVLLAKQTHIRFAALSYPLSMTEIEAFSQRYRIPKQYRELSHLTKTHYEHALALSPPAKSTSTDLFAFLKQLDIQRRMSRFHDFLLSAQAIASSCAHSFDYHWLHQAALLVRSVNITPYLQQGLRGNALSRALNEEREKKLNTWLNG